ncbi:hypothetical protein Pint_26101 [Pistacia integerrima]|uniref:Uncharacterized protein n=1 Tax=Pistacia integerrima TaxID=434235 RepID=A0ACC0YBV7_9ROSI|nr:hypothetical protein Pint_26101 [Pistacia integerrima]
MANMIIEEKWKGKKRCFGVLFPNFGTRHKLSKKAARKVKAVAFLLAQGEKFLKISSRPFQRRFPTRLLRKL